MADTNQLFRCDRCGALAPDALSRRVRGRGVRGGWVRVCAIDCRPSAERSTKAQTLYYAKTMDGTMRREHWFDTPHTEARREALVAMFAEIDTAIRKYAAFCSAESAEVVTHG